MLTCTSTMMSRSSARDFYVVKRPLMTITYCRTSWITCSWHKEVNLDYRLGLWSRLNQDRPGGNLHDMLQALMNSIMNYMFMTRKKRRSLLLTSLQPTTLAQSYPNPILTLSKSLSLHPKPQRQQRNRQQRKHRHQNPPSLQSQKLKDHPLKALFFRLLNQWVCPPKIHELKPLSHLLSIRLQHEQAAFIFVTKTVSMRYR